MKIRIAFAVCMFLFITNTLSAAPQIMIVGGDTYDWKKVTSKNSPLQADITLKNGGDEKLIISEVKPGCGCTTAPLDKSELKPGESTQMHVKLNLTQNSGPVSKSITISSNDPQSQRKILWLKADVVNPISISPTSYFTFQDLMVGVEKEAKVTVKNTSSQDITFSDVTFEPANMLLNQKTNKTLKPGEEMELIVKIRPEKKGYVNCSVTFKTSHPDYPEIKITGYGNVKESPLFNNNQ